MRLTIQIATILVLAGLLAGCSPAELATSAQPRPLKSDGVTADSTYLQKTAVKGGESTDGSTAVENALIWLEKYSKASETIVRLQEDNRKLAEENGRCKAEIAKATDDLRKAQKELREANQMLMEMRSELEKWKANVLGYRNEMYKAHEVELAALKRILRLLGGEVPEPTRGAEPGSTGRGTASVSKN